MKHPRRHRGILAAAVAGLVLAGPVIAGPAALAHDEPMADDGVLDNAEETHGHHDNQHGGDEGHLPATSENLSVVGRGIVNKGEGRIADVGVHKSFAYLTAFREPKCTNGGVHVMDISNLAAPTQVTFIPSSPGTYAGEGSQTISLTTPKFSGDVLAFNNEICDDKPAANGGMTLVDVTNPRAPKRLVEHAGDLQPDGDTHEIHSVFVWDAGDKAYAVLVDDEEATDVDIMDITDPRKPVMIAEYDLTKIGPKITQDAGGLTDVFLHDMVVKQIAGRWVMLASYWDGGYVTLDVTDPAKATYIGDSDFAIPDSGAAEFGLTVDPEGNAHQAEFTRDNRFILTADEDFGPYKPKAVNLTTGAPFAAAAGSGGPGLEPDVDHDFTTKYVGLGCDAASVPAAAAGEIAVVERGVCDFTVKIGNAAAAGYDAVVVFNREGSDSGTCTELVSMIADGTTIPSVFVGRDTAFGWFGQSYDDKACTTGDGTKRMDVAPGTLGQRIRLSNNFDGWGYVRLLQNGAGKLQELDTYAIPEAFDRSKAEGFGDLSVHEIAVSEQRDDLAYVSYYSGGARVIKVVEGADGPEIQEVARFIDQGGNNFWGVQVFSRNGQEYVAASDRDSGLYILKYTGSQ